MSAVSARLSRIICKAEIADPMSGFFMLRREVLEGAAAPFRTGILDSSGYPGVIAAAAASQ
jgi:hypothetical protein